MQDWVIQLEHLQFILKEFDVNKISKETDLICYFQEAFKPSIQVEIENQIKEYEDWNVLIQKVIAVEVKSAL